MGEGLVYRAGGNKFNFTFSRVYIYIHLVKGQRHAHRPHRISPLHNPTPVALEHGGNQATVIHKTLVDEQKNPVGRTAGNTGIGTHPVDT